MFLQELGLQEEAKRATKNEVSSAAAKKDKAAKENKPGDTFQAIFYRD